MIDLLQQRLDEYEVSGVMAEQQAIKEIIQEITLFGLWKAGFFDVAAFQGGTCLRVLYSLPRFSEDLDFILKTRDSKFEWQKYLEILLANLQEFGLSTEVRDRSRMDQAIRKALLKDNSIGNQLNLSFYRPQRGQNLTIKLEIDVNPPDGSVFDYSYLDFPADFEICHQDRSSNFSLKLHALLCREYVKGRDWYDFSWYVRKGIRPNLPLLQAALIQKGPWEGQDLTINSGWVRRALIEKVTSLDWKEVALDVERFLPGVEKESLKLWNVRFFSAKAEKLFDNA